jgi:hypothetical protein
VLPTLDIHAYTFTLLAERYELVIAREMLPALRDPAGKLWYDLPHHEAIPAASYAAENARWQAVKALILDLRALLLIILEQAMVDERRWQPTEFRARFLENPLQRQLAQTLIWGVYNEQKQLVQSFRIAEDYTFATIDDHALPTLPAGTLGIVYPLHLSSADRTAWSELLHDYKFVQPFPQIGRGIYTIDPAEISHATGQLKYRVGTRLEPRWSELKRLGLHPLSGWRWQIPRFTRRFVQQQLYVQIATDYEARLQHITFQANGSELPIQQVPPLVLNEVLFTIQKLAAQEIPT